MRTINPLRDWIDLCFISSDNANRVELFTVFTDTFFQLMNHYISLITKCRYIQRVPEIKLRVYWFNNAINRGFTKLDNIEKSGVRKSWGQKLGSGLDCDRLSLRMWEVL